MRIGPLEIPVPLALAPMEEISDTPFRVICKERGADLLFTEFTNCEALIRDVPRARDKIGITDFERPIAIQLYGSREESLERAAGIAESFRPDFLDINCGCWVKKIANRGDGAGLLRDLKKFEAVVKSVVRGTALPVTVKTRLGWDSDSIVILDVVRMLEQIGVQAVTVHCRTRKQGYTGRADWSWLPRIKQATGLPLIANGDIATPQDVAEVLELGSDGVMIGRAAIENPWIFEQAKHYLAKGEVMPSPSASDRIDLCIRHLKDSVKQRGEARAVTSFRKFYAPYLKGMAHSHRVRIGLMDFREAAPIEERLRHYARLLEEHVPVARA